MIFRDTIVITKEYRRSEIRTKRESRVKTNEELMSSSYNRLHSDGRIYYKKGEDGYNISFSVSPYSKDYLNNIEANIKDLVRVIHKKGYLTVSSCQGHTDYERTFVTVAVNNSYHVSNIKKIAFKPFITVIEKDLMEYGNTNVEVGKGKIHLDKLETQEREKIIEGFNLLTRRGYSDYKIIEIQIGFDLLKPTRFKFFKRFANKLLRRFFIKRATQNIKKIPFYDL